MLHYYKNKKMKNSKLKLFIILMLVSVVVNAQRISVNLNDSWKFNKADNTDFNKIDIDDTSWRVLNVPHDWSFEEGIDKKGTMGQRGGYHSGGIAWYRKKIDYEKTWDDKLIYIEFDGVYMNSEVWINGQYLGKRPYGYISFRYEISKYLNSGKNTIAVRVDNELEPSARWYHACGIYAPVNLTIVNPIHIAPNGIFVTTPKVLKEKTTVFTEIKLKNTVSASKKTTLESIILSQNGKEIQKTTTKINIGDSLITTSMEVYSPEKWSPETPYLYSIVNRILVNNKPVDEVTTNFGIRTIDWKTETGFWLNDKNIKIKGVCEHWEGGPVAGAWTKPMLRWKLTKLKNMGINAIRTAHNPFPPMFYDICDEIGLLVMNEIFDGWHKKATHDYGEQAFDDWWQRDATEWITRDRNHPSVFCYSLGNETHSDIAPELINFCRSLDSTRKYTSGSGNTDDMEIAGVNGESEYKSFLSEQKYDKPFIATEAPHTWQTRGFYRTMTYFREGQENYYYDIPNLTEKEIFFNEWTDPVNWKNRKQHLNSSYDNAIVFISARKKWERARDLPWHSGHFRWTGFDYYGESQLAHGGWPFRLFMGGAIDVAGFEKDLYYFYQSQWAEKPMVHILPSWTHPRMAKGTKIPVWVYSNADEIELFLNGVSLGKDKPGTVWNEMQCEWMVPYEPGKLEAVAYKDNKEIGREIIQTAGAPHNLKNTLQRLDPENGNKNYFILTTEGIDNNKVLFPYAENTIRYHFEAPIEQTSLENGDPVDPTNQVSANYRKLFMGKTRAFINAPINNENSVITMAAIMGDKSLFLSKEIAIVVEQIELNGKQINDDLTILYTTDGSDPEISGNEYNAPFSVTDKAIIKAVIKENSVTLLSLTEAFGQDEGMFWGDENSRKYWKDRGYRHDATKAEIVGGTVTTDARRYFGEGVVTFNDKEGQITWYKENDGAEADYRLLFKYTHNDTTSMRPMKLLVNDKEIKTFQFKPTGKWKDGWEHEGATVKLRPGANFITLKTTGQSGPTIDALIID
ncbi:MAG: beta-galactosidase [Polaribacter sp.]|jgi:beta-galactosidase